MGGRIRPLRVDLFGLDPEFAQRRHVVFGAGAHAVALEELAVVAQDDPIGAFVELEDGCRSWVVAHGRDCDKTPLYYLCMDKNNTEPRSMVFKNPGWEGGYSAESLKIISTPEDPCP